MVVRRLEREGRERRDERTENIKGRRDRQKREQNQETAEIRKEERVSSPLMCLFQFFKREGLEAIPHWAVFAKLLHLPSSQYEQIPNQNA